MRLDRLLPDHQLMSMKMIIRQNLISATKAISSRKATKLTRPNEAYVYSRTTSIGMGTPSTALSATNTSKVLSRRATILLRAGTAFISACGRLGIQSS